MDRLWAPWRMEFIRKVDKGKGCFLCRAAASGDDRERLVVRRGETCLCMLNRYPYNNGHLLLAPFRHESELEGLTGEERTEMLEMATEAKAALDRLASPHGYNIGFNLGRAAGAGLAEHIHLHVVPRWVGDANFMTTVGSAKVIPQALEEMWENLSREWDRVAS